MGIQVADFGRTGHRSTRTVFGAAALSRVTQEVADRTLEVLLRHGVNHIDTAASYGDSELRVRPWLRRETGRFFLATKTDARTAGDAREELHRSLDRLGVDHVDLWQLHNLADPIEWDIALSPGGVIEAAVDARAQGLVRFSLERFDFDSVLLPYNFVTMQLPYYAENFEGLVKTCAERKVAVQTIKSIALRPWRGREHSRSTWYEPLGSQAEIDLAVWWVLGRPGMFLNTAGDVDLLPLILDAAERFESRPSDAQLAAMLERAEVEPLFV
jgi:aryl-alcohol dehydrogenase-like predicted oxidoreductase